MTPEIAIGGSADLDELMLDMGEGFPPDYGEAWTRPQCSAILMLAGVTLLLARMRGEPAGFALLRTVVDEAELLLLAVRPAARRSGVGRALVDRAAAAAAAAGCARLFLEMRDGNPAHALYRATGFAEIGRRPGYYRGPNGVPCDAITLSRRLDPPR
ncbi:MAG: GNAT family N-acetyltransferase [Sphingomonas fennica]